MTTQELKQYIDKVLGNSIRCLLPSYWWKRLFNQVADRVDEVEQSTTKLIESKIEEVKMPIVESVDALEKLEAEVGEIATVGSESLSLVSSSYFPELVSSTNNILEDWGSYKRIGKVEFGEPYSEEGRRISVYIHGKKKYPNDLIMVECVNGEFSCVYSTSVGFKLITLDEVNEKLQDSDYRVILVSKSEQADKTLKLYAYSASADAYIKSDSWEKLAKEHIVSSEEELKALDVEKGTIAKVAREEEKFVGVGTLLQYEDGIDYNSLFTVKKVSISVPKTSIGELSLVYLSTKEKNITLTIVCSADGKDGYIQAWYEDGRKVDLMREQTLVQSNIDDLNSYLSKNVVRYISAGASSGSHFEFIDTWFKVATPYTVADAYIKGETWTRLLKEGDVTGGSRDDKTLTFYAPIDNVSLSDTEKQHNAESYQKVAEGFESDKYYDIKVLLSTFQLVALDVIKTINPASDNGRLKLIFGGVGSGIDLQKLTVTSDGNATITIENVEESGVELRDLYIYENYDGTFTELTEEQKAWNLETLELVKQGKAIVRTTLHGNTFILELFNEDSDYQFGYTQFSPSGGVGISVYVAEDGLSGIKIEESRFDSELSTSSENAVQNKVVTAALNNKVDKADIKTINGESILGEGNIVVNVDISGLATKEELNAKQDKISDLETIRSGAAKGATALQEHQDISHLATKEELTSLTNEIIANEEVHAGAYNDLNTRLNELSENVQGETVTKEEFNAAIEGVNNGISAKQDVLVSGTNIKTINNESILGSGNIEINVDTSALATKEELESLTNEVITNEEVSAAAFNEINDRINAISENVSGTTVTKEEFESTVETINQTISDNKSATDTAIEGLETSIGNVDAKFANYATTESLNGAVETINNTIVENEEITAAAINDFNTRLAALEAVIANL